MMSPDPDLESQLIREFKEMRLCTKMLLVVTCISDIHLCVAAETQFPTSISAQRLEEIRIERALGDATMSWLADRNDASAAQCDRLVDSLLAIREPTARSYFIAAQVANLRGKPREAIAALESAMRAYPDEKAPGLAVPVKIVASFRIASLARTQGDMAKVETVYESILAHLQGQEEQPYLSMFCNLYMAEVEADERRGDAALTRLKLLEEIPELDALSAIPYHDLCRAWARYRITELTGSKAEAASALAPPGDWRDASGMAVLMLKLNGFTGDPLSGCCRRDDRAESIAKTLYDRVLQSDTNSIDVDLVRLACGFVYQNQGRHTDAEKYFEQLFQDEVFLSPTAGLYLAVSEKALGAVDEAEATLDELLSKYPSYTDAVREVRQSSREN